MANNADLFFDADRIRVLNDLDVAPDAQSDATIRLDPGKPSITAQSSGSDGSARIQLTNDQGEGTPVVLSEDNQAGFLELTGGAGQVVRFDAQSDNGTVLSDPEVELSENGERKASIRPGEINLLFNEGFPGFTADDSGTLTLTNRDLVPEGGRESIMLDGNDSALVLSTTPEGEKGDAGNKELYGGGDLVLQSATSAEPDIQVHVQGETGSAYGVLNDNRARIRLHGPSGTLELGRQRLGPDRPSKTGTVSIRSENGDEVLRMGSKEGGRSEVVFEYSPRNGPSEPRGKIQPHEDGLMVYDAGGHEALLFKDSGVVETRKEVLENASI